MGGLGIGVLIGSHAVNQFVGQRHRRAVIWYGAAYLTQALFFAVMTQFTAFAWGALMLLLIRISSGVIIPLDTYMLQVSTRPAVRGRVFALHGSTYGGVMQLSYAMMGLAIARFGIHGGPIGIAVQYDRTHLVCSAVHWIGHSHRHYPGVIPPFEDDDEPIYWVPHRPFAKAGLHGLR